MRFQESSCFLVHNTWLQRPTRGALHSEFQKHYQSTGRTHDLALQNLVVPYPAIGRLCNRDRACRAAGVLR